MYFLSYFNSLSSYLYYLINALDKHGIHSPFLYNLYTQVICGKIDTALFSQIEMMRKSFAKSNELIEINDLGSGSKTGSGNLRTIKNIVHNSVSNRKKSLLIYKLINQFKPYVIIEMGTSLGLNTAYMSLGVSNGKIYSMEGCEQIAQKAAEVFTKLNIQNIEIIVGNFDNTLADLLNKVGVVNFVFIDGNHKFNPTMQYFEMIIKYSNEQTVVILDDINWSAEMKLVWESVKSHQNVTCTVDLYEVGIVFFNKSLSKQNFILKF